MLYKGDVRGATPCPFKVRNLSGDKQNRCEPTKTGVETAKTGVETGLSQHLLKTGVETGEQFPSVGVSTSVLTVSER